MTKKASKNRRTIYLSDDRLDLSIRIKRAGGFSNFIADMMDKHGEKWIEEKIKKMAKPKQNP